MVDTEVCDQEPGEQICVEEVEEQCEKVPHEECHVVQEQVCDDHHYLPPPHHQYQPGPKCRTVDKRVCNNIWINKCVQTPQQCSPGPSVRCNSNMITSLG